MARTAAIRHSPRVAARARTLLLAIGAVVVVGLAIALFQLTRVDSPTAPPVSAPRVAAPEPPAHPEAPVATPAHEPQPEARTPTAAHPHAPDPIPTLPSLAMAFMHDVKRDENGKLVPIIAVSQLRAQLHLTTAPMQACLDASKDKPTGTATLAFTVAAKDKHLIIDSTSVDDDATLVAYPELLACLHQTASAFQLDDVAVPELGTPIYVRRHVKLEAGALVENSIFNFSYNPR